MHRLIISLYCTSRAREAESSPFDTEYVAWLALSSGSESRHFGSFGSRGFSGDLHSMLRPTG